MLRIYLLIETWDQTNRMVSGGAVETRRLDHLAACDRNGMRCANRGEPHRTQSVCVYITPLGNMIRFCLYICFFRSMAVAGIEEI